MLQPRNYGALQQQPTMSMRAHCHSCLGDCRLLQRLHVLVSSVSTSVYVHQHDSAPRRDANILLASTSAIYYIWIARRCSCMYNCQPLTLFYWEGVFEYTFVLARSFDAAQLAVANQMGNWASRPEITRLRSTF